MAKESSTEERETWLRAWFAKNPNAAAKRDGRKALQKQFGVALNNVRLSAIKREVVSGVRPGRQPKSAPVAGGQAVGNGRSLEARVRYYVQGVRLGVHDEREAFRLIAELVK